MYLCGFTVWLKSRRGNSFIFRPGRHLNVQVNIIANSFIPLACALGMDKSFLFVMLINFAV